MSYYISTGTGSSEQRSDTTYGMTMIRVDYGEDTAKTAFVSIPYRYSPLDCTPLDSNGAPFKERRTVTYEFLLQRDTTQLLNSALNAAVRWLSAISHITFDSFKNGQIAGVRYTGSKVEYVGMHLKAAKLTVTFSAEPWL
jgi:hypothetical protein